MAVSVVGVPPLRMALTGGDEPGGKHVFECDSNNFAASSEICKIPLFYGVFYEF